MEILKKVTQRLQRVRNVGRFLKEDGLINTTDLLVATAATVVLAAGVGGTVLSTLDESKYGKAQPDAQAIGQAIMSFYKDTGKWPAQQYHSVNKDKVVLVATGPTPNSTATTAYNLPSVANEGLKFGAVSACGANSGQGFVSGGVVAHASSSTDAAIASTVLVANLNDYLVRKPNATEYPNWDGPYVQEISVDPWERAWVANLAPLYCSEVVVAGSTSAGAGSLGYAWLISGGTNRTITTKGTDSNLDPLGDDTGINMGKLTVN